MKHYLIQSLFILVAICCITCRLNAQEKKLSCKIMQQAEQGKGIDLVVVGDGFTIEDLQPGGCWEAALDTETKYLWHWEPLKSFRDHFNVYAVPSFYDGPDMCGGIAKGDTIFTPLGNNYTTNLSPQRINPEKVFRFAYENTPVKVDKGTPHDMFVLLVINTDQGWGGWCTSDWYVDRPGWGQGLVPVGIFYRFLYGSFTHELIGHAIGRFADEYLQSGKENLPFPEGHFGTQWYLDNQKKKGITLNVTFSENPDDTLRFVNRNWAWMVKNNYRGVGTYEGAVHHGKNIWRATWNSTMKGGGRFGNYNYINPVQRELIVRRIYELSGRGAEYSFEKFLEYDKRNADYDRKCQLTGD